MKLVLSPQPELVERVVFIGGDDFLTVKEVVDMAFESGITPGGNAYRILENGGLLYAIVFELHPNTVFFYNHRELKTLCGEPLSNYREVGGGWDEVWKDPEDPESPEDLEGWGGPDD